MCIVVREMLVDWRRYETEAEVVQRPTSNDRALAAATCDIQPVIHCTDSRTEKQNSRETNTLYSIKPGPSRARRNGVLLASTCLVQQRRRKKKANISPVDN